MKWNVENLEKVLKDDTIELGLMLHQDSSEHGQYDTLKWLVKNDRPRMWSDQQRMYFRRYVCVFENAELLTSTVFSNEFFRVSMVEENGINTLPAS